MSTELVAATDGVMSFHYVLRRADGEELAHRHAHGEGGHQH
ncbi:MAG: hypothetical protein QNJ73_16560 [Gammaproteobacteria bacterium]|nr:hypothetical protein [Gammaproteobacteria bacterium]